LSVLEGDLRRQRDVDRRDLALALDLALDRVRRKLQRVLGLCQGTENHVALCRQVDAAAGITETPGKAPLFDPALDARLRPGLGQRADEIIAGGFLLDDDFAEPP